MKRTAYCVKCRRKRPIEGERIEHRGRRRMAAGVCGTCGTKVFRILAGK